MSYDCVVDASVGIKLFLDEPLSERADALFDHLADEAPARFFVPDLFFIECANILWKYVQYHGYPREDAQQDVIDRARRVVIVDPTAGKAHEGAIALREPRDGDNVCIFGHNVQQATCVHRHGHTNVDPVVADNRK